MCELGLHAILPRAAKRTTVPDGQAAEVANLVRREVTGGPQGRLVGDMGDQLAGGPVRTARN